MKFRARKLKLKKATFGRGPHFLFNKRHKKDMERAILFGAPIRYSKSFLTHRQMYQNLKQHMEDTWIQIWQASGGASVARHTGMSQAHGVSHGRRPELLIFDDIIDGEVSNESSSSK